MRKFHLSYDLINTDKYTEFEEHIFMFFKTKGASKLSKTSESAIIINFSSIEKPKALINDFKKEFEKDIYFSFSFVAKGKGTENHFCSENPNDEFKGYGQQFEDFKNQNKE